MQTSDEGIRNLINGIILQAVLDLYLEDQKDRALADIDSEYFQYICECVDKDVNCIRKYARWLMDFEYVMGFNRI